MTLQVVDDSRVARIHLCSLLEEAGYAPDVVVGAQSAAASDLLDAYQRLRERGIWVTGTGTLR